MKTPIDNAAFGIAIVVVIRLALAKKPVDWLDFMLGIVTGLIVARSLWVATENEKIALGDRVTPSRLVRGVIRRSFSFLSIMLLICVAVFAYNWLAFD